VWRITDFPRISNSPHTGRQTDSAVDLKEPIREWIENNGYTIILNVGDQASDLFGGHAGKTFKLPNPFYVIP
jgi:acid phosphatase